MIPLSEIQFEYVLSRGPGGQHVNRTLSGVRIRWNPMLSSALTMDQRNRLIEKVGPSLNAEGEIVLRCDEFRSQEQNKQRCLEKLAELVAKALVRPKPRKKTKPKKSAVRKRLEKKRRHSEKKQLRRKSHDN